MLKDITIQLDDNKTRFIHIYEGDGSNLLEEDKNEGYVDYVMIDDLEYDEGELEEQDGGQMMIKKPFDDEYPQSKMTTLIEDALEFIGYDRDINYTIIQCNY